MRFDWIAMLAAVLFLTACGDEPPLTPPPTATVQEDRQEYEQRCAKINPQARAELPWGATCVTWQDSGQGNLSLKGVAWDARDSTPLQVSANGEVILEIDGGSSGFLEFEAPALCEDSMVRITMQQGAGEPTQVAAIKC